MDDTPSVQPVQPGGLGPLLGGSVRVIQTGPDRILVAKVISSETSRVFGQMARGAYGHNVWARDGYGKSGAGYFAIGFGAVRHADQAAMKWIYNRFFRQTDQEQGGPYDTVSRYPHLAVSAFLNWPVDIPERHPSEVRPHAYRDSQAGFYCRRNRWRDADETVITVLLNPTRGYMESRPDRALRINAGGKHSSWGTVAQGHARFWAASPKGETSSLALADGACIGVDFTDGSGVDTLLVIAWTTG